jgi:hypothetical protein
VVGQNEYARRRRRSYAEDTEKIKKKKEKRKKKEERRKKKEEGRRKKEEGRKFICFCKFLTDQTR